LLAARICCDYVQTIHLNMAASDLVLRKDLNAADGLEGVKADASQILDRAIVPDGAAFWRGNEHEIADLVVGRDSKPVSILAERENQPLF
jgi:hypothetical protein